MRAEVLQLTPPPSSQPFAAKCMCIVKSVYHKKFVTSFMHN